MTTAGRSPHTRWIIEIGAVLVDGEDLVARDEFQSFVRPVRHPTLTPFCQELTSIRQADVERAPPFAEVIAALTTWMYGAGATVFASWGDYDRKQLEQDCGFHGVPYPMPGRHVNLKALFSSTRGIRKKLGMAQALQHVGLPLDGTHHRGIDDARNIARLVPYAAGVR